MKISKIGYQIQQDDRRGIEKSLWFHMLRCFARTNKIAGQMSITQERDCWNRTSKHKKQPWCIWEIARIASSDIDKAYN